MMENYEQLSLAFKGMLERTKTMKIRRENLEKIIKNYTNERFIASDQSWDLQLEYDGISTSLEYLKPEIKRTIIMLKICLYRQKTVCVNPAEKSDCAEMTSNFERKLVTNKTINEISTPIPIVNKKGSSAEGLFQFDDIEQSHHTVEQIHIITSKSESNIQTQRAQIKNSSKMTSTIASNKLTTNFMGQRTLVNLKNVLTIKSKKFTGERVIIRVGIG